MGIEKEKEKKKKGEKKKNRSFDESFTRHIYTSQQPGSLQFSHFVQENKSLRITKVHSRQKYPSNLKDSGVSRSYAPETDPARVTIHQEGTTPKRCLRRLRAVYTVLQALTEGP